MRILIATSRPGELEDFASMLSATGAGTQMVPNGQAAIEAVKADAPTLVVIDAGLPDYEALKLASTLISVNAFIHTAVVSDLGEEEFHEASEGLGVLTSLPNPPGVGDASALFGKLKRLGAA